MATIRVICPRCSEWREEDESKVDKAQIDACVADGNPIAIDCDPCAQKSWDAEMLREAMGRRL